MPTFPCSNARSLVDLPRRWPGVAGFVLALLFTATIAAEAQTGTVRGQVVDEGTRQPLAGAQIFIPDTRLGALTNASGAFLLVNVPEGTHQLRVQMIGYGGQSQTVVVAAGETATADFELGQSAIALDEIVVTGAGAATEKRKLGNTVGTINEAAIETAPVNTVAEVLQGREPGVTGLPGGGLVGEGAKIRIRGSSSLTQSNEPIVYVDGVRVDTYGGFGPEVSAGGGGSPSRLDDINPDAIERIEILKGAAAATLYGTEASNGVIQIFTKSGSSGAPRWNFQAEYGLSRYDYDRFDRHAGFVTTQEGSSRDEGVEGIRDYWGLNVQPYEVFEVDLVPNLFETGQHQSYSLSVDGGSDAVTYFLSGRLQDDDGPYGAQQWGPAADLNNKKQANGTVSISPWDNFRIRANALYTESYHEAPGTTNNTEGTVPMLYMSKPEKANAGNPTGVGIFTTVRETQQIITNQDVERFAGGISADYNPMPSLNLQGTFGIDIVNQEAFEFKPFGWNVDGVSGSNPQGARTVSDRNYRAVTLDTKASWNEQLSETLSSTLVVGGQGVFTQTRSAGGTGERFPAPGLEVAEAGADQTVFENFLEQVSAGVYAQEQIGWRNYAFLTLGARYDKHSAFGEETGGAIYPKISLSIVPSDMPGYSSSLLSSLRFRGAIGQSGLQPGAFDKFTTFSPTASELGPGVTPNNLGNPELKPEVSTEWELGADLGFFDDRAALTFTYWDRTVDDLLVARQFVPSGGFLETQLDNVGQMRAQGLEIGLNGSVVNSPRFSLNLFANAAYLREEVTDLGDAPPIKIEYYRYRTWIQEGYAPGAFFGPQLLDAEFPLDTNKDGEPDTREQLLTFFSDTISPDALVVLERPDPGLTGFYLGKQTPDWSGSFGADVGFLRNFELRTMFEYKAGNFFVQNLTEAFRRSHALLGRNTPKSARVEATLLNPASTPEERLDAAMTWASELKALSPAGLNEIYNADFIRWRELSLTYNVPQAWSGRFGADNLAFTFAGRNLALFTKYPGVDPEVNASGAGGEGDNNTISNNFINGVDAWGLPLPRRFVLSVRVGF